MIKFLRKIRQNLLTENKFTKYLVYAIGEIILVVIGILIALWLNNLNTVAQNKAKGEIMLLEIKENLISDTLLINDISAFNMEKAADINTLLRIASEPVVNQDFNDQMFQLISLGRLFTNISYQRNSTGYNTLTNSGKIEIITNTELRHKLNQYYLKTNFAAFEELKNLTRSFKYYILPKIANKELTKDLTGLDFQIKNVQDVKLYKDEKMISNALLMLANIDHNEKALVMEKEEVVHLIALIDDELKK